MRDIACFLATSILIVFAQPASACHHKARQARVVCPPAAAYYPGPATAPTPAYAPQAVAPTPAYAPQAVAPTPAYAPQPPAAAMAPAGPEVQPTYRYTAAEENSPAYLYTYDSSGKLIVQQWMDFVFRGGKESGMARPPLPVIGWFQKP